MTNNSTASTYAPAPSAIPCHPAVQLTSDFSEEQDTDVSQCLGELGLYKASDKTLRATACNEVVVPASPHCHAQVDFTLPPAAAFTCPGATHLPMSSTQKLTKFCLGDPSFAWPPVLGQRSLQWEDVLSRIKRPEYLWDVWKPNKTLKQLTIPNLWLCYNSGEPACDNQGKQTGLKPPLQLVEQHFQSQWRKGGSVSIIKHILPS